MSAPNFYGVSVQQIRNNKVKKYFKHQLDQNARNKIVVDLGAGSGILSFLAVAAGAKQVFAIENNKTICELLEKAVAELGLQSQINVINLDFIHDDISQYLDQSDICVSEIVAAEFSRNIFPFVYQKIKADHKHLYMIPQQFNYQFNIFSSPNLNKMVNWDYQSDLDHVLDKIYLEFTVRQPIKRLHGNNDLYQPLYSEVVTSYDFNNNTQQLTSLSLPDIKTNLWLEVMWHFDKDIYNLFWQTEYIPLWLDWFSDAQSIGLSSDGYYHTLTKQVN